MKTKLLSSFILFVYIFVFDMIFHGLLSNSYAETASLWRGYEEMEQTGFVLLRLISQFLSALFLVEIFSRINGPIYMGGLFVGLLWSAGALMMHTVAPYPVFLTVAWIIGAIVQMTLAGFLYSEIVKKLVK